MKDYKTLMGKHVEFKKINCRVVQVPQDGLIKIDSFALMPSWARDDIGKGCGTRVELSPLEFERMVNQNIPQPQQRERFDLGGVWWSITKQ